MAEILGTLSGSDTLAGVVSKLREFGCQYRDVPQAWHEYVSYLETLDRIQAAIPALLGEIDSPDQSLAAIEDEGGEKLSAVLFCNDKLTKVISDAQDFSNKFNTGNGLPGSVFPKLWGYNRKAGVVFSETSIRLRIDSVAHVVRMLQIAIGLAALARTNSGHTTAADQVEGLREAMQEQLASFRHLNDEMRDDAEAARLSGDGENPDIEILRRPSLGSNASSWGTESLFGGDLQEAESSTTSRPPPPRLDSSCEPSRREPNCPLSASAVPHEAATTENQSQKQTGSSEADLLETVEVEFPDESFVSVSLDPSGESTDELLIAVDAVGARETESDQGDSENGTTEEYQSEAELFADFLESAARCEVRPDPDEPLPASQIPVRSRIDMFFPKTLVASQCAPDPGPDLVFCIDRIVDDGLGQVLVAREPCQNLPCEHSSIRGLGAQGLLKRLPSRHTFDVTRIRASWNDDYRDVAPGGGEYLVVPPRCSHLCRHTAVEVHGPENPGCILSTYFEASVAPPDAVFWRLSRPFTALGGRRIPPTSPLPRDSDRAGPRDREIRSIDPGRIDTAWTYRNHSDQGKYVQWERKRESQLGPFSAVPCVFCGKDATRPRLESPATSVSATLDTSESYGYRCSLCDGKTWFTGLRWR